MFQKRMIAVVISAAALVTSLSAARFDDKVRNDFFAGFAGDSAALERGMALSGQAVAADPNGSAEALAWHGSGLLFLSGRQFQRGDMPGGMEMWTKAMAEMDKAGEMEPDNVAVLIPRAASWFGASRNIPPEMAKPILAKALADYEHVYELQRTQFDTLGIHPRSELLFGLADGYFRAGDAVKARVYFEKLAALGAESGHLEQAKLFLAGEKYTVRGTGCVGCHVAK